MLTATKKNYCDKSKKRFARQERFENHGRKIIIRMFCIPAECAFTFTKANFVRTSTEKEITRNDATFSVTTSVELIK